MSSPVAVAHKHLLEAMEGNTLESDLETMVLTTLNAETKWKPSDLRDALEVVESLLIEAAAVQDETEATAVSQRLARSMVRRGLVLSAESSADAAASASTDAEASTVEACVQRTRAGDAAERKAALRRLCPCKVKDDVDEFWARIIEMVNDPDPAVRYQVLHNLCDGSPRAREEQVIEALRLLHNDSDPKVSRACRRVLTHYERTGKWNIM